MPNLQFNDEVFPLLVAQLDCAFGRALADCAKNTTSISERYESQLTAQNHRLLLEKETVLLKKEKDFVSSVQEAKYKVQQAELCLFESRRNLLQQMVVASKGLASIPNETLELVNAAETLKASPQFVLENTEESKPKEQTDSVEKLAPDDAVSSAAACPAQESLDEIELRLGRKRPQLDLASLGAAARAIVERRLDINHVSASKPVPVAARTEQTSTNRNRAIIKVREQLENVIVQQADGPNKNAKGSLNGSFLNLDPTTKFEKFAGRLPFPSLGGETDDSSLMESSQLTDVGAKHSFKRPPFSPQISAHRPKSPPESKTRFLLPPKPQPPKLSAAHLYDSKGISSDWGSERPQIGHSSSAFKKPLAQKQEASNATPDVGRNLPKSLREYRKSVTLNTPVDVTYVLPEDKKQSQTRDKLSRMPDFTQIEYERLSSTVQQHFTIDQINDAVRLFNDYVLPTGNDVFTRKQLQQMLQRNGLDAPQSMLFVNALAEAGKLDRLKVSKKPDQTFFAM